MSHSVLIQRVRRFVTKNQLIADGDRVLVGLSGGADSVALVYILNELRREFNFELFLCHLNHQIRNQQADDDERYCRALADKLGLQIYCESQNIPEISEQSGESIELTARNVRYEFYYRSAKYFHANKIALAHHRDDQCETIVFNIIRGCSIHGLRGIPLKRPLNDTNDKIEIIRPLLCIGKAELEDFLRSKNISWQSDHTNYELKASRNIIRHRILPAMEKMNSAVKDHLLELAHQASGMEKIINQQADKILSACEYGKDDIKYGKDNIRIEKWRLETLPEIIACEVVRKMILSLKVGLRKFTLEHFRNIITLDNKIDLPENLRAIINDSWLVIHKKSAGNTQNIECPYQLMIVKEQFDSQKFEQFCKTKTKYQEMIDADKLVGSLEVRFAREGERFHPLGAPGSKKIGDFLTDVKADKSARPAAVVADENSIIWVIGWRIDERVKITDSTKNVLILTAIGKEQSTESSQ